MNKATKSEDYAMEGGQLCPVCESSNLQGQSHVSAEGGVAVMPLECLTCHATWSEVYKLIGYNELRLQEYGLYEQPPADWHN